MKKLILLLTMATALAFGAVAADTYPAPAPAETPLYHGNEISLSLGSGYALNKGAEFQQPYSENAFAGLTYYATKHFGLEVDVPFYNTAGVAVSDGKAYLLYRLPIWRFAPYVGVGGDYNWTDQHFAKNVTTADLSYLGKVGLEYRITKSFGIFGEDEYQNDKLPTKGTGENTLKGGLRFVLH